MRCEIHKHEDEQRQHDVIERAVIGERKSAERIALRHGEAVVAAPGAQALAEIIDHLGERERHHDELEAARAQRQRADDERERHRDQDRERQHHDEVVKAVDRQHAGRIGADAEQRRLPERDQAGVAEQQIDADGGHAVDRDLRREAHVVDAEKRRQRDRGGEQDEQQQDASCRGRHVSPGSRRTARCG